MIVGLGSPIAVSGGGGSICGLVLMVEKGVAMMERS